MPVSKHWLQALLLWTSAKAVWAQGNGLLGLMVPDFKAWTYVRNKGKKVISPCHKKVHLKYLLRFLL